MKKCFFGRVPISVHANKVHKIVLKCIKERICEKSLSFSVLNMFSSFSKREIIYFCVNDSFNLIKEKNKKRKKNDKKKIEDEINGNI